MSVIGKYITLRKKGLSNPEINAALGISSGSSSQQQEAQKAKLQGTPQQVENQAGLIRNKYIVGSGGETTSFNAGLLTFKRGKKEALKDYDFSMVDEHQGQVFLG